MIAALAQSAKKYSFLLSQLIARDFKVKYKRSALGMLWSLLYPVLMMCVMAVVFRGVFRFSAPGVNYLCYLMTGLTLFNYFSEASNLAMSSVVANFTLLNKVYLPKYLFPLEKCLFVGINFLLTLLPLYAVILLTVCSASRRAWDCCSPRRRCSCAIFSISTASSSRSGPISRRSCTTSA